MQTTQASCLYNPRSNSRQRELLLTLHQSASWSLGTVGMLLFVVVVGCSQKEAPAKPSPPEVEVADVVQQNVPVYGEWVAQLNGPVNVDITPKVQGYQLQQNYQNGFSITK